MELKPGILTRRDARTAARWQTILACLAAAAALGAAAYAAYRGLKPSRERRVEVGALGVVPYYDDGIVTVMLHQRQPVCMPEGDLIEPAYEDCFLACGSIFRVEQVEEGRAIIRLTGQRTNCYDRPLTDDVCPGEARISVSGTKAGLWTWLYVKNREDIEAELRLP